MLREVEAIVRQRLRFLENAMFTIDAQGNAHLEHHRAGPLPKSKPVLQSAALTF
jgi:hypothetical protein